MDSLTQIVLGAGVAEVTVGRKIGNKALLIGGIIGTLPDLDVLFSDLYEPSKALLMHRGFSHSIAFCLMLSPLLAWLLTKIFKQAPLTFKNWWLMTFLVLLTHPLLDALTGYGTGLFVPFSDWRVEINSIAIIDVFYTLPFLGILIALMFYKRHSAIRKKLGRAALIVSTAYLVLTLGHKAMVHNQFSRQLAEQNIAYSQLRTSPLPLTNFLWMAIAKTNNGYYMGLRSDFDKSDSISWQYIEGNHHLLNNYSDSKIIAHLKQFSKGFYAVQKADTTDALVFNDLRFGRMGFDASAPYIFSFLVECNSTCEMQEIPPDAGSLQWDVFIRRIFGQSSL